MYQIECVAVLVAVYYNPGSSAGRLAFKLHWPKKRVRKALEALRKKELVVTGGQHYGIEAEAPDYFWRHSFFLSDGALRIAHKVVSDDGTRLF